MKRIIHIAFFLVVLLLSSCEPDKKTSNNTEQNTKLAKLLSPKNNETLKKGESLKIDLQLKEKAADQIDSIGVYIEDRHFGNLDFLNTQLDLATENLAVGRRKLLVKIFKKDGSQENKYVNLKVLAKESPKQYSFKVLNAFPHSKNSYTQGLLYHNSALYESTGQRGFSKLMKVDLGTGQAEKSISLEDNFFGEGLTLLNDRLYQLTWTSQTGFVYDLDNFKRIGTFSYTGEGWGLTSDEKHLIMSDGSNELRFINPNTFRVEKTVQVMDDKGAITKLNELEYVNGEIWANYYEYNVFKIYRINPKSGEVLGVINLKGILTKEDDHMGLDVLNGIAYDKIEDRIFVTGKNYPRLFEIEVVAAD